MSRSLEGQREDLQERYDFNLAELFMAIQDKGPSYEIDYDSINKFIRRNGEHLYEDDILAILRRFDKDGDARLSYVEFVNAVLPNNINKRLSLK